MTTTSFSSFLTKPDDRCVMRIIRLCDRSQCRRFSEYRKTRGETPLAGWAMRRARRLRLRGTAQGAALSFLMAGNYGARFDGARRCPSAAKSRGGRRGAVPELRAARAQKGVAPDRRTWEVSHSLMAARKRVGRGI
jgi:hypothetical protein